MATQKQKLLVLKISENIRKPQPDFSLGKTMLEVGYKPTVAQKPKLITSSKGFRELMEEAGLDDASLTRTHNELLRSTRLDHMVFPLGPVDESEQKPEVELEPQPQGGALKREHKKKEGTKLTDEEIVQLLADVNCTVRKIVHGETARHVYFWAPDNKARKEALDMGYKLKGHYAPEKKLTLHGHVNINPKQQKIADKYAEELKRSFME